MDNCVFLYPEKGYFDGKLRKAIKELGKDGGTLFFHLGTYVLCETFEFPENVMLIGDSRDSVNLYFEMPDGVRINHFIFKKDAKIKNMKIDVNGSHISHITSEGNLTVENVDFILNPFYKLKYRFDHHSGKDMENSAVINHKGKSLAVKNTTFFSPSIGIRVQNCDSLIFENLTFYTSYESALISECKNVSIKNICVRGKCNKDDKDSARVRNSARPTFALEKSSDVKINNMKIFDVFGDESALKITDCKNLVLDKLLTYNTKTAVFERGSENVILQNVLIAKSGDMDTQNAKIVNSDIIDDIVKYEDLLREDLF